MSRAWQSQNEASAERTDVFAGHPLDDPRGQREPSVRTRPVLTAAAAAIGIVLAAALGGCGSSTPATATIHGTVTPSSSSSSVFGEGMNSTSYVGCAATSPAPGTQVTVSDSSGAVVGVGTLGLWSHNSITTSGVTIYPCDMSFMIRNVPQEARYGFAISGVPGTIWESSVRGTVSLTVSDSG